jgi:predicted GNAT family acetyltransferase
LEPATPAHQALALSWMENFIRETDYADHRPALLVETLIKQQQLFFWVDPGPVSMAAWVMPTLHGACMNFVYTPPELRGRGHGKAVVSALARHMFDSGLQFCFIYAGTNDTASNFLYQKIGARTLCEFMRCAVLPPLLQSVPAVAALTGS